MLLAMSGEPKAQAETKDAMMCNYKCRIPQRLPSGRQRVLPRPKTNEHTKNKGDVVTTHHSRYSKTCLTRPCSGEICVVLQQSRPKSANRACDNISETTPKHASRTVRPERERLLPAQKNPISPIHKKTLSDKLNSASLKGGKQIITVPVKQKHLMKTLNPHKMTNLPDQETIKKCEDLELSREYSDASQLSNDMEDLFSDFNDFHEKESTASKGEKITHLKCIWQQQIVQLEAMKNELGDRQNAIIEVYASLRNTKQKLTDLGQSASLPSTDDLHIMNVANMTPDQLLKLCSETKNPRNDCTPQSPKNALTIDMKKINDMPSKLVAKCEQSLATRKDFIEWFENLKNLKKGCPMTTLSKKINEFNAENDMISSSLKTIKNEFLNEMSDFIRTCWNENIALQLRNEDLTCELSQLNSQNADLKKQIGSFEHQKTFANKLKIEGLEKELKEEKSKRISLRDRLLRAEGQVKIGEERAALLESALNQARTQSRTLERTIQQLNDQNKKLREEYDDELSKLKESMKNNTAHLEEISLAKETLQLEKEDLKTNLEELSKHYNESMINMKHDLNKNIAKLIDAEKKYNEEIENKKHLQATIETQCAHLLESELRYKDTLKQLQEKETAIDELLKVKSKFDEATKALHEKGLEKERLEAQLLKQNEAQQELERKILKLHDVEEKLRRDAFNKTELINDLESKQALLNQQLQESEYKMEMYEEQLITLKNQMTNLKEHFGEFENLHHMINEQKRTLSDMKLENVEVIKEIERKKETLKQLTETIREQEGLIKEKELLLNMLSEKQEEQADILLLNQQISEKNMEIETLIHNIETRKEEINQLEKIILNLENKNCKASIQKERDQERICELEKKIMEYEYCIERKNKDMPSEDLDKLIKTLEDELGTQFDSQMIATHRNYKHVNQNEIIVDRNEYNYDHKQSFPELETQTLPTKIVMGNFVKKTYISNNEDKAKIQNLGRKQAITNIDAQKWIPSTEDKNTFALASSFNNTNNFLCEINELGHPKEKLRNIQYIERNQNRDEKKSKMLKLASHRLQ